MCSLKAALKQVTGSDGEGTLSNPGPTVVAELMTESGLDVTEEQVREVYSASEWNDGRSFTWPEIRELGEQLGYVSPESNPSVPAPSDPVPDCPDDDALAPEDPDRAEPEERTSKRGRRGEVPHSHAGELEEPQLKAEANHIWQFVRSEEYVKIHPSVNWKFRLYRESYPNNHQHSEERIRTDFNKASYYKLVYEWLCDESLKTHSFRHYFRNIRFIPMVSVSNLSSSQAEGSSQSQASKALCRLSQLVEGPCGAASSGPEFLRAFNEALWAQWATYENVVKFMEGATIEEMFRAFLLNEYYVIMGRVLDQMEYLDPRVKVHPRAGDVDAGEIQRRKMMLSLMTDGMFEAVEAQLTKMWKAKLVKLPKTSRIPHLTDPPPSFLAREYYSTVQAIVAQASQTDTCAALPAAD